MSDTLTLPALLIAIGDRFGRRSDRRFQELQQQLQRWQADPDNAEFTDRWQRLAERAVTAPHWLSALFPQTCTDFPQLLPLAQSLANSAHLGGERASAAATSRAAWVAEQTDLANQDGLLRTLLADLVGGSPEQGPAFQFLSRYYAWLDLMVAYFVEPALQPLHERIFALLQMQRQQWPSCYCAGYLYQGWEELGLCGIKPTDARLADYGIAGLLAPTDRVLDLGANSGFLALAVGGMVAEVDAIELNPFLVEIGRAAAGHLQRDNVRFMVADIDSWQPDGSYDAVFSLANHCTIDGRMSMDFETYVAKLFAALKPNGWLFFESHNVFGPGNGGPGDDGDLDRKFDIVERYFELVDAEMHRAYVPASDIDKLFVKLRRRPAYQPDAIRRLSLAEVCTRYR
jgi:SAM-dependent methyltransferase